LAHSHALLKKGGKLLIEDFDFAMADFPTCRWYYDTLSIVSEMYLEDERSDYISDPLKKWKEEHYHDPPLHSGNEMIKGIEHKFSEIKVVRNAYLYRSICSILKDDEKGYHLTNRILEVENGLIESKSILPVGLRIAAES
jgi:hypothetical protein